MKRFFIINTVLALTGTLLIGCDNDAATVKNANKTVSNINVVANSNVPNTNTANVNLPGIDTNSSTAMNEPVDVKGFMTTAAEDGMFEVEAGKVASTKAQDAAVKQYGQEMTADHTRANNELKQLAQKKDIVLPTEISAMQKEKISKLQNLSGAEFDREYMKMMVESHQKAVDLFQKQADSGSDAEAKAFASKTLPTLKEHLNDAQNLNNKMK